MQSFSKEYKALFASMKTLMFILASSNEPKIVDDIVDLGLVQRIVEEWLPCTAQMSLVLVNVETEFNPLACRALALTLMRIILECRKADSEERLIAELCRWISSSGAVSREVGLLKSQSTKKGSSNSRKTAAEVLAVLASIGAESVDQELKVRLRDLPL
jgi:hypothetical protein